MSWQKFLFSFSGRITRRDYWLRFVAPLALGWIVLMAILPPAALVEMPPATGATAFTVLTPLSYVLMLASVWHAIAAAVKRCHDRGRSGWFLLIYFIPFFGQLWVLIDLGFFRGTVGQNQYGPEPSSAEHVTAKS